MCAGVNKEAPVLFVSLLLLLALCLIRPQFINQSILSISLLLTGHLKNRFHVSLSFAAPAVNGFASRAQLNSMNNRNAIYIRLPIERQCTFNLPFNSIFVDQLGGSRSTSSSSHTVALLPAANSELIKPIRSQLYSHHGPNEYR